MPSPNLTPLELAIRDRPMTLWQIGAIGVCVMINALDGIDVLAIAFTAPHIAREWGLSPQQVGVLLSSGLAGMAMGALVLSPLADRMGRRSAMLVCLAVIAAGMVASSFTEGLVQLAACRLLTGLGVGGMLPSINTMVAELASGRRRDLAVSVLTIGYPIGATLGGLVSADLIETAGWRAVFLGGGLLSVAAVLLVACLLPESPQYLLARQPKGALARVNRIAARLGVEPLTALPPRPAKPSRGSLRGLPLRPTVKLCAAYFWLMISFYFFLSWTPKLLVDAGLSAAEGISGLVLMNVGGAVGGLLFGWGTLKTGARPLGVAVIAGAFVSGVVFGLATDSLTGALIAGFALGALLMAGMSSLYALAPQIYSVETRSTGTGLALGVGRLGAILGPIIAGLLIGAGADRPVVAAVLATPLLLAALSVWTLGPASARGAR